MKSLKKRIEHQMNKLVLQSPNPCNTACTCTTCTCNCTCGEMETLAVMDSRRNGNLNSYINNPRNSAGQNLSGIIWK